MRALGWHVLSLRKTVRGAQQSDREPTSSRERYTVGQLVDDLWVEHKAAVPGCLCLNGTRPPTVVLSKAASCKSLLYNLIYHLL